MAETAYRPYAPLMVLKPFGDDIWIVDGPEIRMDWLFTSIPFPTRMTIVRLPDDGLWVHSPTVNDAALMDAVAALGPVRFLIAPNSIHYWWVPDWKERFLEAEVFAVPGLAETAKRPLPEHRVLRDAGPSEWSGAIDQVLVPGSVVTEADFLHRASRTLILTDMIENFEPKRVKSRWLRMAMRLSGPLDPDGKMPIDLRLTFRRHKAEVRRAVRTMLDWRPESIILAHGRCYAENGPAEFRRALRWAL